MKTYQWAVIGAGPAGIAAVGKLLDFGVAAHEIVWVDPNFSVGDFGTLWRNVPSNTKVTLFLKFLHASSAFNFQNADENFELNRANKNETCDLRLMADVLQWVTNHLKTKVQVIQDFAVNLTLRNRFWKIDFKEFNIQTKNVILAIGAEPLNLALSLKTIPLSDAMDSQRIKQHNTENDTIGVFGSSHSAILILRNLIEHSTKQIINFYRSPLRYAVHLADWILFDDTGLKGSTAGWARSNLHGKLPENLLRIYSNDENVKRYLPQCDKVIYAIGFKRRSMPTVEGLEKMNYIEQTGIIAPGLFGLGIAFPETKINPLGMTENRVGLWKFMDYLHRVMPLWLNYGP